MMAETVSGTSREKYIDTKSLRIYGRSTSCVLLVLMCTLPFLASLFGRRLFNDPKCIHTAVSQANLSPTNPKMFRARNNAKQP